MSIFNRLFNRSEAPRTIDALIRDIADHQRPEDYSEFLRLLPELQLFLPLAGPLPANIPRGEKFAVSAGTEILARTASIQGLECVLAFTSADHPNLGADYVGLDGREALQMVERLPKIGGLLVQSTGTGWVGLDRQKVTHILSLA